MFRSYLIIAVRNLWKNRSLSMVNIFGLALGIATCLIIAPYIHHELSYDEYNTKADQIYRVTFHGKMEGGEIKEACVMAPVAPTLKQEFPEVLTSTRLRDMGTPRILLGAKEFQEDRIAFADSNFFSVFTLPLISGDARTALREPNTVVLSSSTARRFFGDEAAVGKLISFRNNNAPLRVTGVMRDIPQTSHFHFDMLGSMSTIPDASVANWLNSNYYAYVLLPEGYNAKQLESKLPKFVDKYMGPQFAQAMGLSLPDFRKKGNSLDFKLQPLTDIHLRSDLTGDIGDHGNLSYVYIFSAVSVFMLLIACINFVNLSTAGASKRAREIGMRKVMGSVKGQLVAQFMLESVLVTAVAMVIAILLVNIAMPFFNRLSGQTLSFNVFSDWRVIALLAAFTAFVGVLAGLYPAFFLSSFNPITVLKGRFTAGKGSVGLRSGLVVFQFFISIGLIIGTLVVYRQLSYIQQKELGYKKEQVLVVNKSWQLGNNRNAFKQEVAAAAGVLSVTASNFVPVGPSYTNNFTIAAEEQLSRIIKTVRFEVDDQYIPTLGMRMLAGRNFSREFGTDSAAVIINETAARALGWGKLAVGRTISHRENDGAEMKYRVVGIVNDFHFRPLHEKITALVMTLGGGDGNTIVKLKTDDVAGTIAAIKKNWDNMKAEGSFSYTFLDESFDKAYRAEQTVGKVLGVFAGLTIFVACLGLFGLATFTAERRTKEIGIRKVLGASSGLIISMLSKEFLKLVGLGFLVAAPVAWLVMSRWLEGFAYRTGISWWIFVSAALGAGFIAILTIGFRAMQAARANPVDSLKDKG